MKQTLIILILLASIVSVAQLETRHNESRLDEAVALFNETQSGMEFDAYEFCSSAELAKGHEQACLTVLE